MSQERTVSRSLSRPYMPLASRVVQEDQTGGPWSSPLCIGRLSEEPRSIVFRTYLLTAPPVPLIWRFLTRQMTRRSLGMSRSMSATVDRDCFHLPLRRRAFPLLLMVGACGVLTERTRNGSGALESYSQVARPRTTLGYRSSSRAPESSTPLRDKTESSTR